MDQVSCVVCNSRNKTQIFSGTDSYLEIPGKFNMVCCQKCGMFYINPQPTNGMLAQHYTKDYLPFVEEKNPIIRFLRRVYYAFEIRKIGKYLKNRKSILEIGSGRGDFLFELKRKKYIVKGIELNKVAIKTAEKFHGLDLLHGSIFNGNFRDSEFDCIIMRYVLEHLKDPVSTIKEVYRILTDKGILIINTPNLNSLEYKIFRNYWSEFDYPRHLFIFSADLIKYWLSTKGFRVQEICHMAVPLGWTNSIRLVLKKKYSIQSKMPSHIYKVNIFLLFIFFPLAFLSKLFKKSSRIMVIALKEGNKKYWEE